MNFSRDLYDFKSSSKLDTMDSALQDLSKKHAMYVESIVAPQVRMLIADGYRIEELELQIYGNEPCLREPVYDAEVITINYVDKRRYVVVASKHVSQKTLRLRRIKRTLIPYVIPTNPFGDRRVKR